MIRPATKRALPAARLDGVRLALSVDEETGLVTNVEPGADDTSSESSSATEFTVKPGFNGRLLDFGPGVWMAFVQGEVVVMVRNGPSQVYAVELSFVLPGERSDPSEPVRASYSAETQAPRGGGAVHRVTGEIDLIIEEVQ